MADKREPPQLLDRFLRHFLPSYVEDTALDDFAEEYGCFVSERGSSAAVLWYSIQIIKSIFVFILEAIRFGGVMFKNYLIIALRDIRKNKIYSFLNILGFSQENILSMSVYQIKQNIQAFKSELLRNPEIQSVSLCDVLPSSDYDWSSLVLPEGFSKDQAIKIPVFYVDRDYFKTLGIELVENSDFLTATGYIGGMAVINEQAKKRFGWESAIGKNLGLPEEKKDITVVGVTKDFHLESLHKRVGPYVFLFKDQDFSWVTLRVSSNNLSGTIDFIKKKWQEFAPNDLTQIEFLDQKIARMYREDEQTRNILSFASVLAVTIACLGLFGLAAYSSEIRTKEIGIRKVLGASTASLVKLLGGELVGCVLAANLIAWPVAYLLMRRWLLNFAYRIPIGMETFLYSAALALAVASVTIFFHAFKAAVSDPVDSLRYE